MDNIVINTVPPQIPASNPLSPSHRPPRGCAYRMIRWSISYQIEMESDKAGDILSHNQEVSLRECDDDSAPAYFRKSSRMDEKGVAGKEGQWSLCVRCFSDNFFGSYGRSRYGRHATKWNSKLNKIGNSFLLRFRARIEHAVNTDRSITRGAQITQGLTKTIGMPFKYNME